MDKPRFYVRETSGYVALARGSGSKCDPNSPPVVNGIKETEIMVLDRLNCCRVVDRWFYRASGSRSTRAVGGYELLKARATATRLARELNRRESTEAA